MMLAPLTSTQEAPNVAYPADRRLSTVYPRDYPQGNYQITPGYTPSNCLNIQQIIIKLIPDTEKFILYIQQNICPKSWINWQALSHCSTHHPYG
jgi:hypothetical protein